MSQRITIEIKDKIATCLTELPIVCGNSDYVVDFVFDEEWEKHEVKTAMFVVNGTVIPQVFAGTVCPVPVIQNTLIAWVGVFAGTVDDGTLSTSTPALVKCIPCITDGDKVPTAPPDDVYNQIIGLIEAGMLRGERGEKGEKGEKGDAGAIKFIPVVQLPDKNYPELIDQSAIYVEPLANPQEKNKYGEYIFVNGDWEKLGEITIEVDHSEYVKFTDYPNAGKAGVIKVSKAYGLSNDYAGGGIISIHPADKDTIKAKTGTKGHTNPIVPENQDYAWKVSATTNTETWTDEEKASACETIGAIPKGANTNAAAMPLVYGIDRNNQIIMIPATEWGASPKTIAMRGNNGEVIVATPRNKNEATNKEYVDDLIAGLQAQIDALKGS